MAPVPPTAGTAGRRSTLACAPPGRGPPVALAGGEPGAAEQERRQFVAGGRSADAAPRLRRGLHGVQLERAARLAAQAARERATHPATQQLGGRCRVVVAGLPPQAGALHERQFPVIAQRGQGGPAVGQRRARGGVASSSAFPPASLSRSRRHRSVAIPFDLARRETPRRGRRESAPPRAAASRGGGRRAARRHRRRRLAGGRRREVDGHCVEPNDARAAHPPIPLQRRVVRVRRAARAMNTASMQHGIGPAAPSAARDSAPPSRAVARPTAARGTRRVRSRPGARGLRRRAAARGRSAPTITLGGRRAPRRGTSSRASPGSCAPAAARGARAAPCGRAGRACASRRASGRASGRRPSSRLRRRAPRCPGRLRSAWQVARRRLQSEEEPPRARRAAAVGRRGSARGPRAGPPCGRRPAGRRPSARRRNGARARRRPHRPGLSPSSATQRRSIRCVLDDRGGPDGMTASRRLRRAPSASGTAPRGRTAATVLQARRSREVAWAGGRGPAHRRHGTRASDATARVALGSSSRRRRETCRRRQGGVHAARRRRAPSVSRLAFRPAGVRRMTGTIELAQVAKRASTRRRGGSQSGAGPATATRVGASGRRGRGAARIIGRSGAASGGIVGGVGRARGPRASSTSSAERKACRSEAPAIDPLARRAEASRGAAHRRRGERARSRRGRGGRALAAPRARRARGGTALGVQLRFAALPAQRRQRLLAAANSSRCADDQAGSSEGQALSSSASD